MIDPSRIRALMVAMVLSGTGLPGVELPGARADEVRLSGLWVSDVSVQSVDGGHLSYTTASGGRVEVALERVEGLRLSRYPQYEEALAASDAGRHAEAVRLLEEVRRRSRQAWVDQLAEKRLVVEQAAAGRPVEAVRTFVRLAGQATDPWFVPEPPVEAVREANGQQQARIRDLLTPALARTPDHARPPLQALLDAAAEPSADAVATKTPAPGSSVAEPTADAGPSAILLPATLPENALAPLLRAGRFEEALDAANAALEQPGDLSLKLYLKGMAQLGLAEASSLEDRYKDAGLSFMRVLVYFPRSAVAGYARTEAGYVHAVIGRPDQARKLYDQAQLEIDEEEDPAYHQRLVDLVSRL